MLKKIKRFLKNSFPTFYHLLLTVYYRIIPHNSKESIKEKFLANNACDYFLPKASGIIHIGANLGQERHIYFLYNLNVLWIEAFADIFKKLKANMKHFPKQQAYEYLLTDKDNVQHDFYITNETGSSSILKLKDHLQTHPHIRQVSTITLTSTSFPTFIANENIDLTKYDALVMDTQGSEYTILKGMLPLLRNFRFIKVETANYELYENYPQLEDYRKLMTEHGFKKAALHTHNVYNPDKTKFCCDVTFERVD